MSVPETVRRIPDHHGDLPFPNASRWGDLIVTGGHLADLEPLATDVETQAEQAVAALAQTLAEAGSSLEHVLRIECFLADADGLAAWNRVYARHFSGHRPPRTTLITGFVLDGIAIELQAIAAAR